jgi:ankyrin repeat protein
MSAVTDLHDAVKRGDLAALGALLKANPALAHARSETDPRGTYPLHVAAEFGQAEAARLLLEHGADGFASRPGKRRHRPLQRNKHGLYGGLDETQSGRPPRC